MPHPRLRQENGRAARNHRPYFFMRFRIALMDTALTGAFAGLLRTRQAMETTRLRFVFAGGRE
jgi:hypothetical protein